MGFPISNFRFDLRFPSVAHMGGDTREKRGELPRSRSLPKRPLLPRLSRTPGCEHPIVGRDEPLTSDAPFHLAVLQERFSMSRAPSTPQRLSRGIRRDRGQIVNPMRHVVVSEWPGTFR